MRKGFFILLLLLPQLALAQQRDDLSPKLFELGFRMNVPFVAMNYYIYSAEKSDRFYYQSKTVEETNKQIKAGYDITGLYFTAGVNFTKNWQFEFRYGKAISSQRPRAYLDGLTTIAGLILKRYTASRKFYWTLSMYFNSLELWDRYYSSQRSKDRWKELLGVGFGAKIGKELYLEASLHGVIGDKSVYETRACVIPIVGPYHEYKEKLKIIGFGSINIGYSFGILGK